MFHKTIVGEPVDTFAKDPYRATKPPESKLVMTHCGMGESYEALAVYRKGDTGYPACVITCEEYSCLCNVLWFPEAFEWMYFIEIVQCRLMFP